VTSPQQAGLQQAGAAARKVLFVLGGVTAFWLVVASVVWIVRDPGDPEQPGVFTGTTSQEQQGSPNAVWPQQSQPGQTATIGGQTYTIPTQR
jgi:hypothetical protein